MARAFYLTLILSCLPSVSCIRNGAISGPATPLPLQIDPKYVLNEIQNFYYGKCLAESNPLPSTSITVPAGGLNAFNCGSPRDKRDQIIYELKIILDRNYAAYSVHFQQTADTVSFAGEVAAAGLSGVGALVGAGGMKDILSIASTLTQSTNVSIQKNYFQRQAGYAILAQMDSDRLTKWSEIADSIKNNDVDTYSLSNALDDLQEYRRLGTATAALTNIQQRTGAQNIEASAALKQIREKPRTRK